MDCPRNRYESCSLPELEAYMVHHVEEANEASMEYVDTKEQFHLYEDVKKIRFAQILDSVEGKTIKAKETKALLSSEWGGFIEERALARHCMTKAMINYENHKRYCDMFRSLVSSKKKELDKLY